MDGLDNTPYIPPVEGHSVLPVSVDDSQASLRAMAFNRDVTPEPEPPQYLDQQSQAAEDKQGTSVSFPRKKTPSVDLVAPGNLEVKVRKSPSEALPEAIEENPEGDKPSKKRTRTRKKKKPQPGADRPDNPPAIASSVMPSTHHDAETASQQKKKEQQAIIAGFKPSVRPSFIARIQERGGRYEKEDLRYKIDKSDREHEALYDIAGKAQALRARFASQPPETLKDSVAALNEEYNQYQRAHYHHQIRLALLEPQARIMAHPDQLHKVERKQFSDLESILESIDHVVSEYANFLSSVEIVLFLEKYYGLPPSTMNLSKSSCILFLTTLFACYLQKAKALHPDFSEPVVARIAYWLNLEIGSFCQYWEGQQSELAQLFWVTYTDFVIHGKRYHEVEAVVKGLELNTPGKENLYFIIKVAELFRVMAEEVSKPVLLSTRAHIESGLRAIANSFQEGVLKASIVLVQDLILRSCQFQGVAPGGAAYWQQNAMSPEDFAQFAQAVASITEVTSCLVQAETVNKAEQAALDQHREALLDELRAMTSDPSVSAKKGKGKGKGKPQKARSTQPIPLGAALPDDRASLPSGAFARVVGGDERHPLAEKTMDEATGACLSTKKINSKIKKATGLLTGSQRNPEKSLELFRELLKDPMTSGQKLSISVGLCEAGIAQSMACLKKIEQYRKKIEEFNQCLTRGIRISKEIDDQFVEAVLELPHLQQKVLTTWQEIKGIAYELKKLNAQGQLKEHEESFAMVESNLSSLFRSCEMLFKKPLNVQGIYKKRGSYIFHMRLSKKGGPGESKARLTMTNIEQVNTMDESLSLLLSELGKITR